ncbi:polyketide synthase [Aspergillus karnatakaensis]|uniref:type I polyketide synthase n=1 Tax=Aspergillus karnatakaensis TaxID=1810916 RepID=UPI003CCDAB79
MAGPLKLYVFGDETGDFAEPLQRLCERRKEVLFVHFLEELNKVLRDEVRRQPREVRVQIPDFTDVLDLVKRYRHSESRNQILETTLTCVCQLATVISFFGSKSSQYFTPSDSAFAGFCTGLLSASSVATSQDTLQLISNALTTVRVAFRIGVKVNGAAQRLLKHGDTTAAQSWTTLILGAQKDASIAALTEFSESKGIPKANQPYISANSKDVVSLSGPPETVASLLQYSEYLQKFRTVTLDIFAPFHAPHLYSDDDVAEVLQPFSEQDEKRKLYIPVISGVGTQYSSDLDVATVMVDVVRDILIRPLSFENVMKTVTETTTASPRDGCQIFSVGPSQAINSLAAALRAETSLNVTTEGQLHTEKPDYEPLNGAQKIAIVGMAGRFPNSDDLESFWSTLQQGLDLHRRVPPDRFDIDAHYDPTGKKLNSTHTPYGCFIEQPGLFDPRFFNMSQREAYQTDPMGRLALVTAYEALEMSGFVPNRTPSSMLDRIGTFYGQTSDDWRTLNAAEKIDMYYIPGTIRAFATGRINYHFKFKGPSYNVDTACSSSFAAIQLACTSLLAKECDTALAGGLNVMTTPDLFAGLSRAHFLSKTGSCKTFDDGADGFCRGDGVGTVVLKRLEDAEADNDPILAVVLGTATNHSSEAVSITRPHGPAQEFLYRKILKHTGVDPLDVSYVEMHGTGTQAGDGTEMKSITNVFAPRDDRRRPDQLIHLGALKANIGHGEASAGVASLIKTVIMMQKNAIPPHVGIKTKMNTTFPHDLNERGVRIAFKETPWVRPEGGKRRAYLNNFGASGGNTGLLLEDRPPVVSTGPSDPRTSFVVSLSAKSTYSLDQNIERLAAFLEANPDTFLPALSYTTTARRIHYPNRVSFAVRSISEAVKSLRSVQAKSIKSDPTIGKPAFVFTGQGSHYTALGKQLYEDSQTFRNDVLEFNRIGQKQGFPNFLPLIDGSEEVGSLSPVALQLGQSCIQMALARLWQSWGVTPSSVLGHSLGEYAALNVAGVLSASDTIYLVGRRAQLLEELCTPGSHKMLAIAASVSAAKEMLGEKDIEVACINGANETVISGPAEQMETYAKNLKASNVKCSLLSTPYAFHSAQIEVILEQYKKAASSVHFGTPRVPVISPLFGDVVTDGDVFGPEYLCRHAREAVNFMGALKSAESKGVVDSNTIWLEIGPAPVCSTFIKSSLGSKAITVPSLRPKDDVWKTLAGTLSDLYSKGLTIEWEEVHREYEASHTVLALPSYRFEEKTYWLDYNNNWCLTKGQKLVEPFAPKRRGNHLSTPSVQKVIKEDFGKTKVTVVAESDLSDPDLNHAVTGHLVNGSALCPAGVYAESAMTVAGYIYRKVKKTEDVGLDVRGLEIVKPLIAKGRDQKEKQVFRITATADQPLKVVKLTYNSVNADGSLGVLHATCNVEYGDTGSWRSEWSRLAYLIRSRINVLNEGVKSRQYQKLDRKAVYEGFSGFVEYDKQYHGMKEVVMDQKNLEATSRLEFQPSTDYDDFEIDPRFIDNISHLSGFILNGSGATDTKKRVFVSHGWYHMQIAQPLSGRKSYSNYVRMHEVEKATMMGDVYVFDGDEMVALVGGVKFKAIPRAVIDQLLPPLKKGAASTPSRPATIKDKPVPPQKPKPTVTKASQEPQAPVAVPRKQNTAIIADFLALLVEELGVEPSELQDDTAFADVGLDSLMSLSITGRIREELGLEGIPSSLFTDYPTVGLVKGVILKLAGSSSDVSIAATTEEEESATAEVVEAEVIKEIPRRSAPANPSSSGAIDGLLAIVCEEVGVDLAELLEVQNFAEAGVDSLMSLTITGRAREDLDLDVSSSFFVDYPTVNQAKLAIASLVGSGSGDETASTSSFVDSGDQTGRTTPYSVNEKASPSSSEAIDGLLAIVCEEVGVDLEELLDVQNFAEAGVDSLMSLTITGRAREDLDVDISSSFFVDYPTVNQARLAIASLLGGSDQTGATTPYSVNDDTKTPASSVSASSVLDSPTKTNYDVDEQEISQSTRPATSIVLQGSLKTASKTLFLLPDGSGSATSYGALPRVSPDTCVVGLNCPFMKTPSEYTTGIDGVATLYLSEIRRRQPEGPYILGGWSAGGVLAYAVAHQLIESGEEIDTLILLDSPCPINLQPLPSDLLHFVDSLGLLGVQGSAPNWLIPHFEASIKNLAEFIPYPLDPEDAPKTHIIWARDGLVSEGDERQFPRSEGEAKSVRFLLDGRENIGTYGWEKLVGSENISVDFIDGNHFTMIREPMVNQLPTILDRIIGA